MNKSVRLAVILFFAAVNVSFADKSFDASVSAVPDVSSYGLRFNRPVSLGNVTNYGSAWDGEGLLLASFGLDRSLYRFDPGTGTISYLTGISIPSGWVTAMCFAGGKLYVLAAKKVYIVDPSTGAASLFLTISCASNYGPAGLASDGTYLYSSDRFDGVIRKYKIASASLVATFPVPNRFSSLREMTFANGLVWVLDSKERLVYGVDPVRGGVVKTFMSPYMSYLRSMEYCDGVWWFGDNSSMKLIPSCVTESGNAVRSNPQFARVRYVVSITNNSDEASGNFKTCIAVPASGIKQDVLNVFFDPSPVRFETDVYGQKVAFIEIASIPARSVCNVTMTVDAIVRAVRYSTGGIVNDLSRTPGDVRALYSTEESNFTMSDPALRSAAALALAGTSDPVQLAWSIRNVVMDRMKYNSDGVYLPANQIWTDAAGSCSEYSSVYSALARIDGFSTRFTGSAIFQAAKSETNADGTLSYTDVSHHRYVELYFPGAGWMSLDVNREDSSSGGPYPSRLFLGYDQGVLEFSKTVFDDNCLGQHCMSREWYRRGSLKVSGVAYWTVREFLAE